MAEQITFPSNQSETTDMTLQANQKGEPNESIVESAKNEETAISNPLVSVIMPVHNTNYNYLKIAIDSILNQTYKNLELIIVDDSSKTDIFNEVITNNYTDERIHFVRNDRHEGIGASNARNVGYCYAQGKYIAVLDSDDYAYPERIEKQVQFMEDHPDIGVLGTKYRQIPDNTIYDKTGSNEYLKAFCLFINPPFGHSTVMMRESVLADNGMQYRPDVICDDFRMWLDLIDKTNFANLDEVLVDYRYHEENISHAKEADLDWDARRSQIQTAYRLMDKQLSPENEQLLGRLLTGQNLSPEQLNKALYLHNKTIDFCERTYGTAATEKALNIAYFNMLKNIKDPEYQALWRLPNVQETFRIPESKRVDSYTHMVLKTIGGKER